MFPVLPNKSQVSVNYYNLYRSSLYLHRRNNADPFSVDIYFNFVEMV